MKQGIMTNYKKNKDKKLQYNSEQQNTSDQNRVTQRAKFTYSPLRVLFEKQTKTWRKTSRSLKNFL